MVFEILTSELSVQITVIITFVLTLLLAIVMTQKYAAKKTRSLLFWSSGIWIFAIGVFLEILFAFGIYSEALIAAYLLLVAILVEALALGSMQLIGSKNLKKIYNGFAIISTIVLLYSLAAKPIGNILTNGVVFGNLPLLVAVASSIITFPAAIILIAIAGKGYLQRRSNKLLSIIAGVIIVSIAGTLYIVQYPAFLYIAEFIGILALWYGFI